MRLKLLATLMFSVALQSPELLARPTQDYITASDGGYILQFDEENGEKLIDFIDMAKVVLSRPIKYNRAEVSDTRIQIVGPITVQQEDFYLFFQAVLRAYDFIVVDYGPEGSTFLSVQKITAGGAGRGGTFVKAQAPIVPVEELEAYSQNPAILITTSIPLKYADARNAMSTFNPFFDTQIEQVRAVENSNSLVITGFGTNVWGAYQLVGLVDVPPFAPQPTIRRRELRYASVDEVEPVLTDMLAAAQGLRPGQTQVAQNAGALARRDIEPRIISDPRSNALLLTGETEMVDRMESWVDILDVEVDPRGFTHVVRLQNTDAGSMEEVLNDVLNQEQSNQQAGGRGGQGGGGANSNSLEIPASVVADTASNSLIITASDRKYAELLTILNQLDVRRPQVLVEAAIVETNRTLNEVFNAGIGAAGDDSGGFFSNFGTTYGLNEAGEIDFPATINSVEGGGATMALFSTSDVPIPLFLQWLETNTESRVLSRPSLLTNDNQEAELAAETETAYEVTTTGQNSVTTSSFETVTAGIKLGISPTISAGNYLRLNVKIEVSNFKPSSLGIPGAPPDIISRTVETPITVPDGTTVILGGLVVRKADATDSKVPWVGDLPLIGWLFRAFNDTQEDAYLYVFITSYIIDTDFALLDEISQAREQDYERLGGDVSELMSSITSDNLPDSLPALTGLEQVFEMPTISVPEVGLRQAAEFPDDLDDLDDVSDG
ncbi:MAG: secretin N-terminal domain-containing protein [Planctomycetota bacterium]|nr:secretin N-terminal domain-containing protein [Planctomycetota bacterium]